MIMVLFFVGVRYNGVCHKEGDSFNTIDGCTRCSCSPDGLQCLPIDGACVAGWFTVRISYEGVQRRQFSWDAVLLLITHLWLF